MRHLVALLELGFCADCVGISHAFPTHTPADIGALLEIADER